MKIGTIIIGAAVWLACTGALAADKEPPTAGAKAEAARIITAASAGAWFVDASEGDLPKTRHLHSGLVCGFDPGRPDNHITIYPANGPTPIPQGDDVSCETDQADFVVSVYATRYPAATTVQQQLAAAIAAMRVRFDKIEPYKGQAITVGGDKPQAHLTARFKVETGGRVLFSRVAVAQVGGWTVMQRISGPIDKALAGDLMGELEMTVLIEEMKAAPGEG